MSEDLNHNWINGQQLQTTDTLEVVNPANGDIVGQVPKVTEANIQQSIEHRFRTLIDSI